MLAPKENCFEEIRHSVNWELWLTKKSVTSTFAHKPNLKLLCEKWRYKEQYMIYRLIGLTFLFLIKASMLALFHFSAAGQDLRPMKGN